MNFSKHKLSIPDETRVYYSKKIPFFEITILLLGFFIGCWFLLFGGSQDQNPAIVLCIVTSIFLYINYSVLSNKKVQILLTNKGIQTPNTEFHIWDKVSDEKVASESFRGTVNHFLIYRYQGRSKRLLINDYNLSLDEIGDLLKVYRERSKV